MLLEMMVCKTEYDDDWVRLVYGDLRVVRDDDWVRLAHE